MSLDELRAKDRAARTHTVEIDGHKFSILRPTELEAIRITTQVAESEDKTGVDMIRFALPYVIGWDLTEADIVEGGDDTPVEFSADALDLYAADHASAADRLSSEIYQLIADRRKKVRVDKKKSKSTSGS